MATTLTRPLDVKIPSVAPATFPSTTAKPRLVARWVKDENNQLYCQWVQA
ncbi:hypothetical protein K4A83_21245 [Spirulina subsalsa FACHB-351]|uniref:Uncharacterized protein n=1 Tax=Spirulina subsalsa FACHB-351 TaxID=234711 RepID=A0ABT3LBA3_9CYAN|nr:hypothetical protein [Spirulina subsalsa]MCW6038775.1 hypothetical protein [Spirulina subsalsa FACHB-351]